VLLLRRLGPGGPRGVAVAMFGHTGLGILICRNEYFLLAHLYAPYSILARGLLTPLSVTYRAAFSIVLIGGNQTDREWLMAGSAVGISFAQLSSTRFWMPSILAPCLCLGCLY
jgi:hypothetical protein